MRRLVLLVVVALVLMVAPGGAAETHKMGKKAPSGGLVFVVHGIVDPAVTTNSMAQPDPGNRYVMVDVEVINPKKKQQRIELIEDPYTLVTSDRRAYDYALFDVEEPGPPFGEIPGRFALRGWVTFEIPDNATPRFFRAQGNSTASGALVRLR